MVPFHSFGTGGSGHRWQSLFLVFASSFLLRSRVLLSSLLYDFCVVVVFLEVVHPFGGLSCSVYVLGTGSDPLFVMLASPSSKVAIPVVLPYSDVRVPSVTNMLFSQSAYRLLCGGLFHPSTCHSSTRMILSKVDRRSCSCFNNRLSTSCSCWVFCAYLRFLIC